MNCPFCTPQEILFSNKFAYARFDKYPVSEGHVIIIPYRHIPLYFDLPKEEKVAILDLSDIVKNYLDQNFNPIGYNIGLNVGKPAGQTIMHVHCHIIPRYENDVPDPRGGIRGVIPDKKLY